MPPSPRLRIIKEIAEKLGLDGLAELEAGLVRHRPPPPRLIAALVLDKYDGPPLTARQHEIMELLAKGYSRQQIADELGIGLETVKRHLTLTYERLEVHNSIEAVNVYLGRNGNGA